MTPVQALQKALAAEHAAVHLYGLLGAQSSKSRQPSLFAQARRRPTRSTATPATG